MFIFNYSVNDGPRCILKVPQTDMLFQNSTFLLRFFLRIDCILPLQIHTFHQGLIIQDKVNSFFLYVRTEKERQCV